MTSKEFKALLLFFITISVNAQFSLSGKVTDAQGNTIRGAEVYIRPLEELRITDSQGDFRFEGLNAGNYKLIVFAYEFVILEQELTISHDVQRDIRLQPLGEELSEVVLTQQREKVFALRSLRKVEGTAIYAGKKTEVVAVDLITGNLATNNARQVYNQVVGLNIYDNGDAGLQLNIGGRGLDPNRTANFNTRQNGYDISADVLGYPESYYTPPVEALSEIQVVRGAASLQYGTQFGGLINFKFKQPDPNKKIELITRQTLGSNGLFTSFNSVGGTVGKFSYYNFFNYKQGDGFRPNSNFNSRNYHGHFGYQVSEKTKLIFEATLLDYLAQQAGGLNDLQFNEDPTFSNRERNWFDVSWNLGSLRLDHQFSEKTDFSLSVFGLTAARKAIGLRTNRVDQIDDPDAPRELLVDNFRNWGSEARLLTRYDMLSKESVLLLGAKYYQSYNDQRQGPGSTALDADFTFREEEFPDFDPQSSATLPNANVALFGENIFNITDKLSITPGFRFEYIKTEADSEFREIVFDLAGNVLLNETVEEDREFERSFVLFGVGASYKVSPSVELYGNFSENYRSVTFNDIRIDNPSLVVDENITDEEGYTADLGARGQYKDFFRYDLSVFHLHYDNRIGEIPDQDGGGRFRGNIGTANIYGIETLVDLNVKELLLPESENAKLNYFINAAFTDSEYTDSEDAGVQGRKVEFIPDVNIKTGINFGWKDLLGSLQYTYISEQFTDGTNAGVILNDARNAGIIGPIPAYDILDLSLSYSYKNWKLEAGINNLLDESYFTRRATGYPGPGIIPADPRTFYATLQLKL